MPLILPPSATLWFFRTFGEDYRKITKKAQTSEPRESRCATYKTSEISNRVTGLRANEQYHQMCGRIDVILPSGVTECCYLLRSPKECAKYHPPQKAGGGATAVRSGRASQELESKVRFADQPGSCAQFSV